MKPHLFAVMLWVGYIITFQPSITTCSTMSSNDVTTPRYPDPPTNLRYSFSVKKLSKVKKKIEVVIIWDHPEYGPSPKSYDLSVFPADSGNKTAFCKKEFTGYHEPNISQTANNWTIPFDEGMAKKKFHFGCSYLVKLRSFPCAMPKDKYTVIEVIRIPECIEGDCNCQELLPPVENLQMEIANSSRNVSLSWTYNPKSSIKYFAVKFSRLHPTTNLYRAYSRVEINLTSTGKYKTEVSLSDKISQHKITVVAFDEHLCNASTDAFVECDHTNSCYCTAPNLSSPSNLTIIRNEATSATMILWHYPGDLHRVSHFLASVGYEYPHNHSLNKVETFHVSIPEDIASANDSRLINMKFPCTTNMEAVLKVKISAVDFQSCRGPISKEFPFNCYGLLVQDVRTQPHREIAISFGLIIVSIIIIILICIFMRYKTKFKTFILNIFRPQRPISLQQIELTRNVIYIEKEIVDARSKGLADLFEISNCRLLLGEEIGKGAFGRVCIATADTICGKSEKTTVAVKQIKDDANDMEIRDFLEEIKMMKRVGHHPNIITMLACCTLQQPYCMVMEYVSGGDLLHYLKKLRKEYVRISTLFYSSCRQKSSTPTFFASDNRQNDSSEYLLRSQSSCGDATNLSVVHTTTTTIPEDEEEPPTKESDLLINIEPIPATNYVRLGKDRLVPNLERPDITPCCLDAEELHAFALQIAKGMNHLASKGITHRDLAARNVLIDEKNTLKISDFGLSRSGVYVTTRCAKVPLRWLSVEAIRDSLYTTKSDVWAFGVVLWEICTLGGFPYASVPDSAFPDYLINGHRLQKPDNCSEEIYLIMESCWDKEPFRRPDFSDLCESLESMTDISHVYVNFDRITNRPLPPEEVQLTNSTPQSDKFVRN